MPNEYLFNEGLLNDPSSTLASREAVLVEIAEAVKDELAAAGLSLAFWVTRSYVPTYGRQGVDADEFAEVLVSVVPREEVPTTLTRGPTHMIDYGVDVAIQKRVGSADVDDCDPLMLLSEEVGDLFRGRSVEVSIGKATCIGVANRPVYDPAHLHDMNIFTRLVSLTFRSSR